MSQGNGYSNGAGAGASHDTDPPSSLFGIELRLDSIEEKLDRMLHLAEALSNEWNSLRASVNNHERRVQVIEAKLQLAPCMHDTEGCPLNVDEETNGGGV